MQYSNCIHIGDRVYYRNPTVDRYQIHLNDLGKLTMADVPHGSHLEVLGIHMPESEFDCEMWVLNSGDEGSDEFLSVYGGASMAVTSENSEFVLARLKRAFPDIYPLGNKHNAQFSLFDSEDRGLVASVFLNLDFQGRGETLVRVAIDPFVKGFNRLCAPDAHVFICHASEDKPIVRKLVQYIEEHGASVWLDEREIKVGDSIIQKVGQGIENASHLVVVLSTNSITKPWVTKELSTALMRQLNKHSISILPLRLDDSPIPALLVDVKYADCRTKVEMGFQELLKAVLL